MLAAPASAASPTSERASAPGAPGHGLSPLHMSLAVVMPLLTCVLLATAVCVVFGLRRRWHARACAVLGGSAGKSGDGGLHASRRSLGTSSTSDFYLPMCSAKEAADYSLKGHEKVARYGAGRRLLVCHGVARCITYAACMSGSGLHPIAHYALAVMAHSFKTSSSGNGSANPSADAGSVPTSATNTTQTSSAMQLAYSRAAGSLSPPEPASYALSGCHRPTLCILEHLAASKQRLGPLMVSATQGHGVA